MRLTKYLWIGWEIALPLSRLLHCLVFLPTLAWELFLVGNQSNNIRSKLQKFNLTSLSLFPSQLMKFLHMSKEPNGLSDRVLSYWFPTWKSSYTCPGMKIRQWRRYGRGGPNRIKMWNSPWQHMWQGRCMPTSKDDVNKGPFTLIIAASSYVNPKQIDRRQNNTQPTWPIPPKPLIKSKVWLPAK